MSNLIPNSINMINFDAPRNQSSIIKVIGVGGGGSNAVNYMFKQGIEGVDFVICNTDSQALQLSPIPNKVQIGVGLTEGRGAGAIPAVGKNAAMENIDEIRAILERNTKMLFITAGMGGGTGTGAAPVIASLAKEMDILTVAIVTVPFSFEGRKRRMQAEEGIKELRNYVDTLILICNDKLRELYGDLKFTEAFAKADNILTTAAKGIAEIITVPNDYVNVDFADVRTVMKDSGVALMGSGTAEGENRALRAVEMALSSPLLNDNEIKGASNILLNITSGTEEISMDEISEITDYVQVEAGLDAEADIIFGIGRDASLGNKICISLVATGFGSNNNLFDTTFQEQNKQKIKHTLVPDITIEAVKEEVPEQNDFKIIEKKPSEIVPKISILTAKNNDVKPIEYVAPITNNGVEEENLFSELNSQNEESSQEIDLMEKKSIPEKIVYTLDSLVDNNKTEVEEEILTQKKSSDRIKTLKELSVNLKKTSDITELEKVPAYIRRNVDLNPVTPSNESNVSRYTLSEDGEKKAELKQNNSFLHDNVD